MATGTFKAAFGTFCTGEPKRWRKYCPLKVMSGKNCAIVTPYCAAEERALAQVILELGLFCNAISISSASDTSWHWNSLGSMIEHWQYCAETKRFPSHGL